MYMFDMLISVPVILTKERKKSINNNFPDCLCDSFVSGNVNGHSIESCILPKSFELFL